MENPLEAYRKAKEQTYEQLAAEIGCSKSQAHAWCTGRALPRAKAMAKIAALTEGLVTASGLYEASQTTQAAA